MTEPEEAEPVFRGVENEPWRVLVS